MTAPSEIVGKFSSEETEKAVPSCPQCKSSTTYKDGLRNTSNGEVQRFLCRSCGFRFSEKSYKESQTNRNRQICATLARVKNLDTQAEKTLTVCAEDKRLRPIPPENKGLIVKYAAYLEREGYYSQSSYLHLMVVLAKEVTNLRDPDEVKTAIARHQSKDNKGNRHDWKDSVKMLASYAYDAFTKMEGIRWEQPHYRQKETLINCPDERDLDALISATQSKMMAALLQTLKETYADPSEILFAEWIDLKDNILTINHPVKNHLPGKNELSPRLVAMINSLPKTDKRIFPITYKSASECLRTLRKRVANKLQNPRLLSISFKSYRHFGGSMLAYRTNGNVMKVKAALRHRRVENTMKYIHAVENLREDDFEETVATTPEEVRKLGKAGWIKYDEMTINGVTMHFYRTPKRFGV